MSPFPVSKFGFAPAGLLNPADSFLSRLMMTVVYSMSGREEDARAEAAEVLRINPKFSVEKFEKRAKGEDKETFIGALRKAGLPE